MSIGLEQIVWFVVAGLIAFFGFQTGRKVERPKAIQEGKEIGAREVATQITENTLEKVNEANAAAAVVERRDVDGVHDAARTDPHNLGRMRGP